MPVTDYGIIILAAGGSSRLGTPKQLLMFEGKTLLQHAIDEAVMSAVGDVVVVTGANHDSLVPFLSGNVWFVYNEHWQQGMAGSMQAGLSALLAKHPGLQAVIIMLCDQPFVSSALLKEMAAKKKSADKGIVACEYRDIIGVPTLFSHLYFDALLLLEGAEGAKKVIASNRKDVAIISFPQGAVDIDTREDYERLIT